MVASALKWWSAPLDIGYIVKKARYIPPGDVPYYGTRYLWNWVYRLVSHQKRLAFWGPRFQGMQELLQECTLPEVCAYQWKRCVERAEMDFNTMSDQRVYKLRYEDLVRDPGTEFQKILCFLEAKVEKKQIGQLGKATSTTSVGKWQSDLPDATLEAIMPIMQPLLAKYGYDEAYQPVI